MTAFNLGDLWQRLYVPPPPSRPACEGISPYVFDLSPQQAEQMSRHVRQGQRLPVDVAAHIASALSFCADCPLATRQWCAEAARPHTTKASMVAGGKVFSQGRVVWDVEKQRRADIVGRAA